MCGTISLLLCCLFATPLGFYVAMGRVLVQYIAPNFGRYDSLPATITCYVKGSSPSDLVDNFFFWIGMKFWFF